jgi:hypothetical protein
MKKMSDLSDDNLAELVLDIDNNFFKWAKIHNINPLELTAVILARLTWCAKLGGYQDDYIKLLESPNKLLTAEKQNKETLH